MIPIPDGPIDGQMLRRILTKWQIEVLAKLDIRNDATEFASGIVATETGVTLGATAMPSGRAVGMPTLFAKIDDEGRAADQRFFRTIAASGLISLQNISTALSSTAGASTATVDIAAHNVQMDFGPVAYNSGSIAGLDLSTTYWIYASDPNSDGGAVTYLATTNPNNVISKNNYFVGKITTPAALGSSSGGGGGTGGWARL